MNGEVAPKESELSLQIEPKLITVDGVDATGSSTIARALAEKLRQNGREVVLVEVPKETKGYPQGVLETYPNQKSPRVNLGYLAETKKVYAKKVRPALQTGMIVILVSSEVRNLVHAILDHNEQPVVDSISKGMVTNGLVAGTRVVVLAPPETIVDVLQKRKSSGRLSQHDPAPQLPAVGERINALETAVGMIQKVLPGSALIEINNDRSRSPDKIAEDLVSRLRLG